MTVQWVCRQCGRGWIGSAIWRLLPAAIVLVLALTPVLAEEAAQESVIVPNLAMALPAQSKVVVRWISPPLDKKTIASAWLFASDISFTMDSLGQPWLWKNWPSTNDSTIMNPVKGYKFRVPESCNSMVCLENGALLAATATDLGFLSAPGEVEVNLDRLPEVPFQPITKLPLPGCRLFVGTGDCLYLVGHNQASEEDEVYVLRPEKRAAAGAEGKVIRGFLKVFTSKEPISAVAGNGDVSFVVMGSLIVRASAPDKAISKFFLHPSESIGELVGSENGGLFYATASGVGYIGPNGNVGFLGAPDPQICMQKGTLYILLPESLGVLALDNVDDFKTYNLAFKQVSAADSPEVKITDIRFFETGLKVSYPLQYATEFERADSRFIVGTRLCTFRCAYRGKMSAGGAGAFTGFRCVKTP